MKIKELFSIEKKPRKGLIAMEWAVIIYILFTSIVAVVMYDELPNVSRIASLRIEGLAIIGALWLVYRCIPCRLTFLCRYLAQLGMLSQWYPDLFEFNRAMPYLDHLIAGWEQNIFGMQPALLFAEKVSWPLVSEIMCADYVSYFFIMASVMLFYFFKKYGELEKITFIFFTSFFLVYVIFLFIPVCGPQYYYEIVGLHTIAQGNFPNIGCFFAENAQKQFNPGWQDGFFYRLLVFAHDSGERPIAAFPSSHICMTLIMMLLAFRVNKRFGKIVLILLCIMCFSTIYIRAHYAIDVIAGIVVGFVLYGASLLLWKIFFSHNK